MKRLPVPALVGFFTVLVLVSYWPSLGGNFVYDDRDLIVGNVTLKNWVADVRDRLGRKPPHVRWLLVNDFAQMGSTSAEKAPRGRINYYRPVITMSYMLDAWFWEKVRDPQHAGTAEAVMLNPVGFHLSNVIAHLLNVVLVFALVRALLRDRWSAALTAALYAVHPIHTESVSWIAGRVDVHATPFFLAAFWAYLRFRRSGSLPAYFTGLCLTTVGVFAKEMVAMLFLPLLLFEVLDHRFNWVQRPLLRPSLSRRLLQVLPFLVPALLYFVVKRQLLGPRPDPDGWQDVDSLTAVFSFFKAAGWYLGKTLWPLPLDIYPVLRFIGWMEGGLFLLLHLALASLALWITLRFRAPLAGFSLLGFYLSLAPLSSIVKGTRLLRFTEDVDFPVSERFLYIPSLFLLLGVAWLLVTVMRTRGKAGSYGAGTAAVLLLLFWGFTTFHRSKEWRSNLSLYTAGARTSPESVRMHSNLGQELYEAYRLEEAKAALLKSLNLQERLYARDRLKRGVDPFAYNHLGLCYMMEGDYSSAIGFYWKSYQHVPDSPSHVNNYAFAAEVVAAIMKDRNLAKKSLEAYRRVLTLDPGLAVARGQVDFLKMLVVNWENFFGLNDRTDRTCSLLAQTYFMIGQHCMAVKRPERALRVVQVGLSVLPPVDAKSMPLTATVVANMKAFARDTVAFGREHYGNLLRRMPDRPALLVLRGEVESLGRTLSVEAASLEAAERDLRRALAVAPDHTRAALLLAMILQEKGKEEEAVRTVEAAALARARSAWPMWHETALRAARTGWERSGRKASWRAMLERVLAGITRRLEAMTGKDAGAWNDLGYIHVQAGRLLGKKQRFEDALRCFRRALDLDPKLSNAAGAVVATLRDLGRNREAEAERRVFSRQFPRHPFFR